MRRGNFNASNLLPGTRAVLIVCPTCKEPITAGGIDAAKAVAFCAACNASFALTEPAGAGPARVAAPENPRAVLTRVGDRLAIGFPRGGFQGVGCFFSIFSLIWNGITWTMLLGIVIQTVAAAKQRTPALTPERPPGPLPVTSPGPLLAAPPIDYFAILFLIPFVLIGLITLFVAVYCVWGDAAVAMDREQILFERSLFGRKRISRFEMADVVDIRLAEAYKQNDQPVYGVGIFFKNRITALTFGSALPEDEKAWLAGELYAFWKERG